MGFADLKTDILLHCKNIPGPSIGKKIVVIEADDYGGIRMPSNMAYKQMQALGVTIYPSRYNLLDTLEDKDDLTALFETLSTVRDKNGHNAVLSPFVNVANPDFEKIKATDYREYFYEPFTTTLQKYGRDSDTMKVWGQGMSEGIFTPEFHGREHLCVQAWLQKLQEGNQQLKTAFEYGFVAVNIPGIHDYAEEFRPEFYFTNNSQKPFLHQSIIEGVQLFKEIFGYLPNSFMPSNSVFHPDFEDTVFQAGIPFLNVAHKNPYPSTNGDQHFRSYTFKQKIKKGRLNYYIRNCAFEPIGNEYTSYHLTLKQIDAAFRLNKAAVLSTHRVNFTGGLDKANRDKGLKELKLLLRKILERWPDVEFMSTGDMLQHLKNQ
jgi:hypothetical protein